MQPMPDTIGDRSIVVQMERKLVNESCAPLAELNTMEIRAKCVRFALDAGAAIAKAAKIRGEGLNDRAADTFDPLYVIARLAGGGWEEKLHAAALALAAAAQQEEPGPEILLDVVCILVELNRAKIFSRELMIILRGGLGGMMLDMKYPLVTEVQIAEMLRPYGIRPVPIRIGKVVNRGYVAADFQDALRRYVPRTEVEARLEEWSRQTELEVEAKTEAEKEADGLEETTA